MNKLRDQKNVLLKYNTSIGDYTILLPSVNVVIFFLGVIRNGFSFNLLIFIIKMILFFLFLFLSIDFFMYHRIYVKEDSIEIYFMTIKGLKRLEFDLSEVELDWRPRIAKNSELILVKHNGAIIRKIPANIFRKTKPFVEQVNALAKIAREKN